MTQKAYQISKRPHLFYEEGPYDDENAFLEGLAERYHLPTEMAVFDEDQCIDVLGFEGYEKLRELTVPSATYLTDRENPIGDIEIANVRGETCILYHGDWGNGYWSLWCSPELAETLVKEATQ